MQNVILGDISCQALAPDLKTNQRCHRSITTKCLKYNGGKSIKVEISKIKMNYIDVNNSSDGNTIFNLT